MNDTEQSLVLLIVARLKNPKYLSPTLGIIGALLLFLGLFSPTDTFSGFGPLATTLVAVGTDAWLINSILVLVFTTLCLLGYKKHIGVVATGLLSIVLIAMLGSSGDNASPTGLFGNYIVPGIRWWGFSLLVAGASLIIASGTIGNLSSLWADKSSQNNIPQIPEPDSQFRRISNLWPRLVFIGAMLLLAGSFAPIQRLHAESEHRRMTSSWNLFEHTASWTFLEAGGWAAEIVFFLAGISVFLVGYRRFYEVVVTGVCILGLILARLSVFIAEYNVMVEGIAKAKQMNEQIVKNRETVIDYSAGYGLQHVGFIHWSISWPGWCVLIAGAWGGFAICREFV